MALDLSSVLGVVDFGSVVLAVVLVGASLMGVAVVIYAVQQIIAAVDAGSDRPQFGDSGCGDGDARATWSNWWEPKRVYRMDEVDDEGYSYCDRLDGLD